MSYLVLLPSQDIFTKTQTQTKRLYSLPKGKYLLTVSCQWYSVNDILQQKNILQQKTPALAWPIGQGDSFRESALATPPTLAIMILGLNF